MLAGLKDCSAVPTPLRRRSGAAMDKKQSGKAAAAGAGAAAAAQKAGAAAVGADGLPPEAKGLSWPQKFCETPKGERLELSEEGSLATRTSGVGYGAAFVGPLALERSGSAYFEVEVAELEASRSQTMAIGIASSLPASKSLRVERARDLGEGTYVMGYDLPKVFANGAEVSKISTKEWRPLKELKVGDRVGLLIQRRSMELTVFVNGVKKASVAGLGGGQRWPGEVWGVVDLHGAVKSLWLRSAAAAKRKLQRCATVQLPAPPPEALGERAEPDTTQALVARVEPDANQSQKPPPAAGRARRDGGVAGIAAEAPERGQRRAAPTAGPTEEATAQGPRKRPRTAAPSGGCVLLGGFRGEVQVPAGGMLVIGRDESSDLVLDSPLVPKMVSRRHATVTCTAEAVVLQDCGSTNGTFVNRRKVTHETLRHGDLIVVGNPAQSPKEFHFRVCLPSCGA